MVHYSGGVDVIGSLVKGADVIGSLVKGADVIGSFFRWG